MFNKILIANRGEIAVRIARTARKLGITSVAVYSQADANGMHVEVCDEAYGIGGAAASDSYLRADRILEVAQRCGAQAIHPGYGFLSENSEFARACESVGIAFIGPPASAIEAMGSKSEAKKIMQSANVPLVPGYHGDDQSDDLLRKESKAIGFPQLIKATAGGGGKGMRVVNQQSEFDAALISARREALASFGDDKVLIERYLPAPRHVEMQVFADGHGNVVHLFERDCSIQRRHQKVLEEAPAPGMSESLRAQMGQAAVNCARAIGYVGAGTVEFLLDTDGSFYFMEMNTRLQVEHPVTEMITGLDLVHWQLRVASGEALPLKQSDIQLNGHAFEARIYAEAPDRDFMPATGQIRYLAQPSISDSVRIDTGVRVGDDVGINYDPMIAKLIVHADDRLTALNKMRVALRDYQILGVQTNIGFLSSLLEVGEFSDENFDTGFIEKHRGKLFDKKEERVANAACVAGLAVLPAIANSDCLDPWAGKSAWRMNQTPTHKIKLSLDDRDYALAITPAENRWQICCDENTIEVAAKWLDETHLQIEINASLLTVPVQINKDIISIWHDNREWRFTRHNPMQALDNEAETGNQFVAPMPGAIISIPVSAGDTVEAGDVLLVMEAMKMEHSMVAPMKATVTDVFFAEGDQVEEGDKLISLEIFE
ncbi:MAG: acetyl/propionyl/methylcrotonyl-CoA carboxylase subunit alpha [Gammaproteobacteria bacterium]|nr:acetyl/propionyl/methylcrotonyl-CoA carboxylase subunit alpha [Gammaproteobacteria bacterium]